MSGWLPDHQVLALFGSAITPLEPTRPLDREHVQPASLDLTLGPVAYAMRGGFLPSGCGLQERLSQLGTGELDLTGEGAVLERGRVYLIPLGERLELPPDLRARFNPRSSAGRCDLFTRVLAEAHPRFDEAPEGYTGRLWLEVCSLSFPVRLTVGDRLCQMRLGRGRAKLRTDELEQLYARSPLCFVREGGRERALRGDEIRFDEDGGLCLSVSLADRDPVGYRARLDAPELVFASSGAHAIRDYFEPIRAPEGFLLLEPGRFYVFCSRERLRIPPELACEMLPVDIGIGELRNNYAGFFDNGFGWQRDDRGKPVDKGTPAVLEVRAHDVPFLIEDGQIFFRLRAFRMHAPPERLYGEARATSYRNQELTLARCFAPDPR